MTNPVDTDAVRSVSERLAVVPIDGTMEQRLTVARAQVELIAAADELDRLRAAMTLYKLANVQLRAAVENAPHDRSACKWWWSRNTVEPMPCTCWKADAL